VPATSVITVTSLVAGDPVTMTKKPSTSRARRSAPTSQNRASSRDSAPELYPASCSQGPTASSQFPVAGSTSTGVPLPLRRVKEPTLARSDSITLAGLVPVNSCVTRNPARNTSRDVGPSPARGIVIKKLPKAYTSACTPTLREACEKVRISPSARRRPRTRARLRGADVSNRRLIRAAVGVRIVNMSSVP